MNVKALIKLLHKVHKKVSVKKTKFYINGIRNTDSKLILHNVVKNYCYDSETNALLIETEKLL